MARFEAGNTVARGNRGGGRPRKLLREITANDAPRVWDEMQRIAFDASHPLHRRHAFGALQELARYCFPRPQAVVLEASDDAGTAATIGHLLEVAAARLDQRQRDAERNGACIACGHSGVLTKLEVEVATTSPDANGRQPSDALDSRVSVKPARLALAGRDTSS